MMMMRITLTMTLNLQSLFLERSWAEVGMLARIGNRIIKRSSRVQPYDVVCADWGAGLPLGSQDDQSVSSIRKYFSSSEGPLATVQKRLNYQLPVFFSRLKPYLSYWRSAMGLARISQSQLILRLSTRCALEAHIWTAAENTSSEQIASHWETIQPLLLAEEQHRRPRTVGCNINPAYAGNGGSSPTRMSRGEQNRRMK
jgi:hypothetical protein